MRDSRKRLRDAAAAAAAMANERHRISVERLQRAHRALDARKRGAADELMAASSATAIWLLDAELAQLKHRVAVAAREATAAEVEASRATRKLIEAERDLRATDKHIDRLRSAIDRRAAKAEQIAVDDLSARRARRSA
ncbi:MAG: hypothetical protein D6689_08810 [Deltaproteobacteria bacterium]|nr:MAG: hypothetical protein D6689_08810 [Deltaproteobacteria bacterium]